MNHLKPLNKEDFIIELIEDLGMVYPNKNSKRPQRYAIFKCISCGYPHKKPIQSVKAGSTKCKTCAMTTHGNTGHRLYHTWLHQIRRCTEKTNKNYPYYGERGILISDEFSNDFRTWLIYVESLKGCYEPNLTVDRINNDGNYERGNLRWATKSEQILNSRRHLGR